MSRIVLAIDPGPVKSGWVIWDGEAVRAHGIDANEDIIRNLRDGFRQAILAVEQIKSYGMKVSDSIFDTVFWTGRFVEAWDAEFERVPRMDVKMHLCHTSRAKDGNIRQALIDRFGVPGTKKNPGMLYGIKADEWSAFALAVYFYDTKITER